MLIIKKGESRERQSPRHSCSHGGSRDSGSEWCDENGQPIGNLTSQIFANFYMNPFDHFIKHDCGIHYYGRYVDDFVLVHQDSIYLKSLIPVIKTFLKNQLQLTLHPNKIYFQHYSKGVQFLGAVIKPNHIYIAKHTQGNFYASIQKQNALVK